VTRYVRSRFLEVEEENGDSAILVHDLIGSRLRLNRATQKFLGLFEEPKRFEDLSALGPAETARPIFEDLVRVGFLVPEDHAETISERRLRRVATGFYGCPAFDSRGEVDADVVFLGVPYDHGNHRGPGARFGPDALRAASTEGASIVGRFDSVSGAARGWYDNERDRQFLSGVRMADAGDVYVAPGESPTHVFRKIQSIVRELLKRKARPVVAGGDHSVTYPIASAFDRPLYILQLDAHTDLAPYHEGMENHHGNVISRLIQSDQVLGVYQVGVRGLTPVRQEGGRSKVPMMLSPSALREKGIDGLIEELPGDAPFYVTLDIDCLDPAVAPGTSTPVPGGLTFDEVKRILWALGERRECVGGDLVEVNPERDLGGLTAAVGRELLLTLADTVSRQVGVEE